MRLRGLTMAIAALAWLATPAPRAYADWPLSFARSLCSPELGVFRFDVLQANDPTRGQPDAGLRSARELEAAPAACELPQYRIVVEGRYRVTGHGPCGAVRGQQARVLINGVPVQHRFGDSDSDDGWIELSACDHETYSVELHTQAEDGAWAWVVLCREDSPTTGRGEENLVKQCRTWRDGDPDFPFRLH